MSLSIQLDGTIPDDAFGKRLDQVLAQMFPEYSRSRLTQWVRAGQVTLDGLPCKPKQKCQGGESVKISAQLEETSRVIAQPIELDVVYRDDSLFIINKPVGQVVHPAAGNPDGTMQNALLYLDESLTAVPRSGIVHRLDKGTSGLLVVARTLAAHHSLVQQLQARTMHREYLAVANTVLTAGGTIDAPIGRNPRDRLKMAVVEGGKEAVTHYRVEERYRAHTLVRVQLETGRTHQIRVHMSHRHMPLVGDRVYAGRFRVPAGVSEALNEMLRGFRHQALHATRLELTHPQTGELCSWSVDMPEDMQQLVSALQADRDEAVKS
ncbi:MAG: 23S rRNA pseudouridine(1911/1915/1917) synthase RluD [Gammaproteobacteria bacterium]